MTQNVDVGPTSDWRRYRGDLMPDMYPRELVVGVDGSAAGRKALAFAMREAGLRGSSLHVVTVWQPRNTSTGLAAHPSQRRREGAQQLQDLAVRDALAETSARPVLMRSVVTGDVGEALCAVAGTCDFLVLGSTHAASASAMPLGSVGEFCLRHAGCPLVVVPRAAASEAVWQPAPRLGCDARDPAS